MKIILSLILLMTTVSALAWDLPQIISSKVPPEVQRKEAIDLIARAVGPDGAKFFQVSVDRSLPFRAYKLFKGSNNTLYITGWDGISIAKGFHIYMKYYLNHDITWTNPKIQLPSSLELPDVNLSVPSESPIIYYQNVCTWGYSFVWWDWTSWRRHIDWMAMMGVSLTIAPVQEEIWFNVYKDLGLSNDDINNYFSGPAFQPWQRMGNIHGWGGPLSPKYRKWHFRLQRRIIQAERALGMSVALPAFAGHVPKAIEALYPTTNFTTLERWNNFSDDYCCASFLEPTEPLFQYIAGKFLNETILAYGSDHIYFTDPFNEMQPPSSDTDYMRNASYNIYQSIWQVDSEAIWLLQGWMFVKNPFWTENLIKSFLTAVPKGKLLVLDLQSEQFPQYERTNSYEGQPFIWCMLHNFGGTLGMHGSAHIVNTRIREAREMSNSSMIGVGITPEGIYQNYAMYALALERAWVKNDFNLNKWFNDFANKRYGVEARPLQNYWNILKDSVYSFHSLRKLRGKYVVTRRPAFNIKTFLWYNHSSIAQAYHLLLKSNASIPESHYDAYENDLVDITRQYLQVVAEEIYTDLRKNFKKKKLPQYKNKAQMLLQVFDDLEDILQTNEYFLLGVWLKNAKARIIEDWEEAAFQQSFKTQLTLWGPKGEILDYACKQWSGLVRDYYKPRWSLFLNETIYSLEHKRSFDNAVFKTLVFNEVELPFTITAKEYPSTPSGNTYEVSNAIYKKWQNLVHELDKNQNSHSKRSK